MWKDMESWFVYWTALGYHHYLVSLLFADLLSLHLVIFLILFNLVYVTLYSNRYMLELKFQIYHRAVSLSSQASSVDVCSIGWRIIDQALPGGFFWPVSMHTNWISNSATLSNNYVSLPSDLCTCVQAKKIASQMKPYSSSVTGLKCLVRLQSCYVSLSWPSQFTS